MFHMNVVVEKMNHNGSILFKSSIDLGSNDSAVSAFPYVDSHARNGSIWLGMLLIP